MNASVYASDSPSLYASVSPSVSPSDSPSLYASVSFSDNVSVSVAWMSRERRANRGRVSARRAS